MTGHDPATCRNGDHYGQCGGATTTPPIRCVCSKRAVWVWQPKDPPPAYNRFLCDDHAAQIDLDELHELGSLPRPVPWPL